MFSKMKSDKFFVMIPNSASLKQATVPEKTSMLQWEEPTPAAT